MITRNKYILREIDCDKRDRDMRVTRRQRDRCRETQTKINYEWEVDIVRDIARYCDRDKLLIDRDTDIYSERNYKEWYN